MEKKPNFIFIISHDTGRCIEPYGYKVKMPNVTSFSKEAVKFNNYFCPAPQCSPSRGSIITGLYPHRNGLIGLAHKGFGIKKEVKTLQMYLMENGYETTLIGLSHETIEGEEKGLPTSSTKLGYNNYIKVDGNRANKVVKEFINFMDNRKDERPFFISVGFEETHRPFDEYEQDADNIDEVMPFNFLPDTQGLRKDISLFNGSAKVLDSAFGELLKYLNNNNNILENTYIIFTTDHGVAFPRCKGTLMDSGLETLLIIRKPNILNSKGFEINELLCNIDMMPTILELAGIEVPDNIDGKSFVSLINGEKKNIRDEFFCEMTWHDKYYPVRGIRTNQFKYIKHLEKGPRVYMTADIYSTNSALSLQEEFDKPNDDEELYDLILDPFEMNNLAYDIKYHDVLIELRKKVENWMKETDDPILKGRIEGEESIFWKNKK